MRPAYRHAVAALLYLAGAFYVTSALWADPYHRVTSSNERDYGFFQFVLSHAATSLSTLSNPLFNGGLNAPFGVNMMANTSMLGLSIPLAPITLLWGPQVSFALSLVIALAGTAAAWYWFLLRHITKIWPLALAGGAFCGFSPAMISQANAHPNIAAQFMVPLILSQVITLKQRPVRNGVILGLMIVYQLFINEEILLYTALACAIVAVVHLFSRPFSRSEVKPYLAGLGVAAAVSLAIMAYPLWFQFFGPQHYTGPFWWAGGYGIDLAAFPAYATQSIAGAPGVTDPLGSSPTEQNAFYGWPLCVLSVVAGVALWRAAAVRMALVVGVIFAALSLGDEIKIKTIPSGVPGPWRLVSSLPLFDSIIVTRIAMMVAPAMAVILVIAADRLLASRRTVPVSLMTGLAVISLVPLLPRPLPTSPPAPVPEFFSGGTWRSFVDDGTIVPVPPDVWSNDSLNWLVATGMRARIADGYFIGPRSQTDPVANFGPEDRPTGQLLRHVAATGQVPEVTDEVRSRFAVDMAFWRADALVLSRVYQREQLRALVDELTGRPGQETGGVIVWDLR
jgi:hypothetical protein